MKVILVPVADRPECLVSLNAAFDIAARLDANVIGCHVRPHRRETSGASSRKPLVPDEWSNVLADLNPEEVSLRCEAAKLLFESRAQKHGFALIRKPHPGVERSALWKEMVGTPSRVLAIVGPLSDLIITSRPGKKDAGRGRAFLLAALLQSGQPVLVIPRDWKGSLGKKILIAWNQSTEAANAVSGSRAILRLAEEVTIVSAGKENLPGPKASYLADYLALLGIRSSRLATPGEHVSQELEAAFKARKADLLIMGAYSRGRTRELILGGLTEQMLFHSRMPVLLLHH